MKLLVTFLLGLYGSSAIFLDEPPSNRIINSHEGVFSHFPYSVSIQQLALVGTPTRGHKCGGTLFTLQHVLTSATCTFDLVNGTYIPINVAAYRIFSGTTLLTDSYNPNYIRTIANVTVHPQYSHPPTSANNIAVITLVAPFLNTTVTPITLPQAVLNPPVGAHCQIASWGAQFSNETATNALRYTSKLIHNQTTCAAQFGTGQGQLNILSSMICATSSTSAGCIGDEGVALACDGGIVGILFRYNMCSVSPFPEVYTRVSNYLPWIRSISGSSTFRPELTFLAVFGIIIAKCISIL